MSAAAGTLALRAGRGARWAVLQSAGKHGIDLLVFLCLARWVAPQAFGLVAMANAVVVLAAILVEMGLGDALVQRPGIERRHTDTAFWCALGCGSVAAVALLACAPLAQALGHADLVPVLRAMTPLFILHALTVVPQALMQRELAFRPLALRALAGSAIGGLAGLLLAFEGAGAWSLVAQQLAAAGVGVAGLWLSSRWRPGLGFCRSCAAELFAFSRHVLGARALNVLASKADDLAVGLLLGPLALGYYSVACRLLLALEQLFSQGIDSVALSAFSRTGPASQEMRALYLAAIRTAALWAAPVFVGAILVAPDLIMVVVGPAWLPSATLLQILLPAGFLHALMHFNHAIFKACGRPELSLRVAGASTAVNVLTLAAAVQFGVMAVAISYLARSALIAPLGLLMACRLIGLPLRDYLRTLIRPSMCLLAGLVGVLLLKNGCPQLADAATPAWWRLLALGCAASLGYLLAVRMSIAPPRP